MQCRYTVPDWHRYVNPAADAVPIMAACRLLVKEGEPASDPRSIACAYWGHQRDCPLYDGPGARANPARDVGARTPGGEVPVAVDTVWPVRTPGAKDGMRQLMIGMGILSTALLVWTGFLGLSVLNGRAVPAAYLHLTLAAAAVSVLTHVLATLRTWVQR
jgi:hypothetical protein